MQECEIHLSLAKRRLLKVMREVGHGRVEAFSIHHGEPRLDPAPRVVYELRVPGTGATSRPRSEGGPLQAAVEELFRLFTRIGSAWVERLEVRDGLPFRIAVEERGGGEVGVGDRLDRPSRPTADLAGK